jgi:hypothetical protein
MGHFCSLGVVGYVYILFVVGHVYNLVVVIHVLSLDVVAHVYIRAYANHSIAPVGLIIFSTSSMLLQALEPSPVPRNSHFPQWNPVPQSLKK